MRALKVAGLEEVARLRRRTRRALSLGRIYPEDCEYITSRLDEVEAKIVEMHELDESGREVH
jgi:hypothetical protein